ncbi:hypothetical protein ACLKMH_16135 [Psychromonas sp. KJ10-10]|uniref:hypothetical protein n=1 Tax=Psychromonas sp. KJ10-10 TaxID=3391823 RepID=UPI0039B650F4
MNTNKIKTSITFKTSLLNDCTNHLAFQLDNSSLKKQSSEHKVDSLYESPLNEVVTTEFVRGYN